MAFMRSPCVVIGAGAAGLAMSRALTVAGVDHVVLERREVADTWRHQRWDSFRLNTPSWMNSVLGDVEPGSFASRDEVVRLLTDQAAALPVRTGTPVTMLTHDGLQFLVETAGGQVRATTVVLASGLLNVARLPVVAGRVSRRLVQLHSSDYRSAARLPSGAVLVVGGAQSGCQIAEDLALAGRRVHLCTSRVGRYPWTYRGRELMGWLADCGFWDERPADLVNPADTRTPFPVIASGGRSLDLRILSGLGVILHGSLDTAAGEHVTFRGSPAETMEYADQVAARLVALADTYIAARRIQAAEAEPESWGSPPGPGPNELDLAAAGITSILWATGVTGDLSWVQLPVHGDAGTVLHDGCSSPVPGLWYLGFPWLTRRRSGIFYGVPSDVQEVLDGVLRVLSRGAS